MFFLYITEYRQTPHIGPTAEKAQNYMTVLNSPINTPDQHSVLKISNSKTCKSGVFRVNFG